jgi:oligogalacturonide lyase
VIQLTSYPTPAAHFPYDWPSITPDNRYILLYCQRWGQRNAPWDIFRVEPDGLNLFQLTEDSEEAGDASYYGRQHAIMSHDGTTIYVLSANILKSVDIETGQSEPIVSLENYAADGAVFARMCLNGSGDRLFIPTLSDEPALRLDLTTGSIDEIDFGGRVIGCFQGSRRVEVLGGNSEVEVVTQDDGNRVLKSVDPGTLMLFSMTEDGTDREPIANISMFGHHTILAQTDLLQGTGKPPHRCIWIVEAGNEPTELVSGPYFWHSAASFDGEWIVSDTNWPDEGLQYIHVPTRHFRTLCNPHATLAHYEFGHPHPCISRDGRLVVFRSDRTGMSQVYVAHITEEFRDSVIAGELDNPLDKWM